MYDTENKKFINIDNVRCYKTGDIGVIDEKGIIHFKGREDNQVKIKGFRIEIEEIESYLLKIQMFHSFLKTSLQKSEGKRSVSFFKNIILFLLLMQRKMLLLQ